MTKASIRLQELRRRIYTKAKTEKRWRFWGLYCHICNKEVLQESYRLAKANNGAPGIDGKSFEDIETEGLEGFLEEIRQELLSRTYRPLPNRRVEIPKGKGKTYVSKTPRKKKRREIGKRVKAVLRANRDKPLNEVIQSVNAVVRGWVNYFRIGNSSRTFDKVRYDVEKRVRKFVMKRQKRRGFGWKRWSREEIYQKWGLYRDYRIRYIYPKATPGR